MILPLEISIPQKTFWNSKPYHYIINWDSFSSTYMTNRIELLITWSSRNWGSNFLTFSTCDLYLAMTSFVLEKKKKLDRMVSKPELVVNGKLVQRIIVDLFWFIFFSIILINGLKNVKRKLFLDADILQFFIPGCLYQQIRKY